MSDASLTLRLLNAVAQGVDARQPERGEASTTRPATPGPGKSVTSRQMLQALMATAFDLPSAIVRVARGD